MAGVKAGRVHTCVGWQVTLCDAMWQVTLRSSVMGFQSIKSYTFFTFGGVRADWRFSDCHNLFPSDVRQLLFSSMSSLPLLTPAVLTDVNTPAAAVSSEEQLVTRIVN